MNMKNPIGIIMGRGALPVLLADHLKKNSTPFVLFPIEGQAYRETVSKYPHEWIPLTKVRESIQLIKGRGVSTLVFAGYVRRPTWGLLKLDLKGLVWMTRLLLNFFKDDALLSSLVRFFEKEGFNVVGPHDLMPSLLMPAGVVGKIRPSKKNLEAIILGARAAQSHGAQDRGQGVIVSGSKILAKEDSRGTNAMLENVAQKYDVSEAILVKMMKPQQEQRVDLPVIGTETIEKLSTYGYKGVSLEAQRGLILEKEEVIKEANEKNIFVYGYKKET